MITLHEDYDQSKADEIAKSMQAEGWLGAPLVVDGEQLITGTHRYIAWRQLGGIDMDFPRIELAAVFAEDNKDLEAIHEEYGFPVLGDMDFVYMLQDELSDDIKDKYGIDLN